jgi:glycosyltransferase involved in cell wall biosynthesis
MNNVLITTYPEAFLHRGGGEVELLDLLHNLRLLGVKADIYSPTSQPLAKYDVVLHYSVARSGLDFVRQVKNARRKLVLMPSIWWIKKPSSSELDCVGEFFKLADTIVFKSQSEYENITNFLPIAEEKVSYCRWGVDACFEEKVDPDLFRKTYDLQEYILNVGIIDERKNQLSTVRACVDSPLPFVFVGDHRDRSYYEACVRSAPRSWKFLPYLPPKSEILRSALAGCKAFVEASLEPCGFSALEAGLARVPLVLSESPWTSEHFGVNVYKVDPYSPDSIREGVLSSVSGRNSQEAHITIHANNVMPMALEGLARALQEIA